MLVYGDEDMLKDESPKEEFLITQPAIILRILERVFLTF